MPLRDFFNSPKRFVPVNKSPDNPIFKIFYVDVEEVETFSFSEGPKTYIYYNLKLDKKKHGLKMKFFLNHVFDRYLFQLFLF